ncbi:MAG: carboxypeptidase-like regulatory domain-containing protein, partial [Fulvivirga sp.]
MHYKLFFLAAILCTAFTFSQSSAQQTISGTVTDSQTGAPLIGAEIIISGTNSGTITGVLGEFSIEVAPQFPPIEVRYMGYESKFIE